MTRTKKSFFEKITGIRRVDDDGAVEFSQEQAPMNQSFIEPEDTYEFPESSNPQGNYYQKEEEIYQPPMKSNHSHQQDPLESEGQLTIDVYQTDDDIVIKSTIAGVKPEDLDVNINADMVTIRGERKQDEEVDPESYYYQECYWGPFSRSIILPVEIIAEKAEAAMKNGILTIKLPKADTTRTRKIQVRGF